MKPELRNKIDTIPDCVTVEVGSESRIKIEINTKKIRENGEW
jgi:hypothetical protein